MFWRVVGSAVFTMVSLAAAEQPSQPGNREVRLVAGCSIDLDRAADAMSNMVCRAHRPRFGYTVFPFSPKWPAAASKRGSFVQISLKPDSRAVTM